MKYSLTCSCMKGKKHSGCPVRPVTHCRRRSLGRDYDQHMSIHSRLHLSDLHTSAFRQLRRSPTLVQATRGLRSHAYTVRTAFCPTRSQSYPRDRTFTASIVAPTLSLQSQARRTIMTTQEMSNISATPSGKSHLEYDDGPMIWVSGESSVAWSSYLATPVSCPSHYGM